MFRSTAQKVRSVTAQTLQQQQRRHVSNKVDMTYRRDVAIPIKSSGSGRVQAAIYNNVFARSPIYYAFWFAVAVVANDLYDKAFDFYWENSNKNKQFKDVIPVRFPNLPPGTEPDEPEGEGEEGGDDAEDSDEGGDDKEKGDDDKEDDKDDKEKDDGDDNSDEKDSPKNVKGADEQHKKIAENKEKATNKDKQAGDKSGEKSDNSDKFNSDNQGK